MHLNDSWNVSEEQFPVQGGPEQKLRLLLKCAVLAPSGHNTQPWLLRLSGDKVELYADRIGVAVPSIHPAAEKKSFRKPISKIVNRTSLRAFRTLHFRRQAPKQGRDIWWPWIDIHCPTCDVG